jgi:uncharacterized membrane protein
MELPIFIGVIGLIGAIVGVIVSYKNRDVLWPKQTQA